MNNFSTELLYRHIDRANVVYEPVVIGDDGDESTGLSPHVFTSASFVNDIEQLHRSYPTRLAKMKETYPQNRLGSFPPHALYFAATKSTYREATFPCAGIEMTNSLTSYNSPAET